MGFFTSLMFWVAAVVVVTGLGVAFFFWFTGPPGGGNNSGHRYLHAQRSEPLKKFYQSNTTSLSPAAISSSRNEKCKPQDGPICKICCYPMEEPIKLRCGHVFDEKCYNTRKYLIKQFQPNAPLCISC